MKFKMDENLPQESETRIPKSQTLDPGKSTPKNPRVNRITCAKQKGTSLKSQQ